MKKIVSILAVAAMAASMFAVDVSVTSKLSSTLFKYDGKAETVSALGGLANAQTADYATISSMSVSTDNAGASIKFWGGSVVSDAKKIDSELKLKMADVLKFGAISVWFKPTDMVKLSFLGNDDGLFGDKYNGYEANKLAAIPAGYGVEIATNGLTVKINAANDWMTKANKDADVVIGDTGIKVAYGADFGSVAAIVDFKNTFKDVTFGAGYSGNIADVGVVLTAAYDVKAKKALIVPSLGGSVEGIGYALCAPVTIVKDANKFGLYASASYTVNSIGLKAYFEDANLAADTFACKVGLDVTGNVGIASWKVVPSYTTDTKVFAIGFETGVSF